MPLKSNSQRESFARSHFPVFVCYRINTTRHPPTLPGRAFCCCRYRRRDITPPDVSAFHLVAAFGGRCKRSFIRFFCMVDIDLFNLYVYRDICQCGKAIERWAFKHRLENDWQRWFLFWQCRFVFLNPAFGLPLMEQLTLPPNLSIPAKRI